MLSQQNLEYLEATKTYIVLQTNRNTKIMKNDLVHLRFWKDLHILMILV